VLAIGGGAALTYLYNDLAELFIAGPKLLALLTVALIGIPVLEARRDVSRWEFWRPHLTDAKTASGEAAKDAIKFEESRERLVRMPNGRLAVVRPGIRKFLARLFGGAAYLEGQDGIDTETDAIGSSSTEQVVWVSASADEALEYEPEGWSWRWPSTGSQLLGLGLLSVLFAGVGQAALGTPLLGIGAIPVMALRPESGHARTEPANAHQRAAYVTALYSTVEHEEAETLEELREDLISESVKNQKHVQQALETKDATLIQEAVRGEELDGELDGTDATDELEPEEPELDPDADKGLTDLFTGADDD
jgi:hypothetical protein